MTREVALKILKGGNNRECTWSEYCEAYNMAIEIMQKYQKIEQIIIDNDNDGRIGRQVRELVNDSN